MTDRPLIGIGSEILRQDRDGREVMQIFPPYAEAILAAGGIPIILPQIDATLTRDLIGMIDGLVIPGGDDFSGALFDRPDPPDFVPLHTRRLEGDGWLVAEAFAARLPIFAICYGAQLINVLQGGTLILDIPSEQPAALCHKSKVRSSPAEHEVTLTADSCLHGWGVGPTIRVNSFHHQAIDRLGTGLRATGTSADGLVELIEGDGLPSFLLGVQWHPEKPDSGDLAISRRLFERFVAIARERKLSRV